MREADPGPVMVRAWLRACLGMALAVSLLLSLTLLLLQHVSILHLAYDADMVQQEERQG